ncbi:MAG: GntR family transcriptional regulator [Sphingobium sp.]
MTRLQAGPTALYAQLSSIIRSKIMIGDWEDGYEIPTLNELCEDYKVARVTARQAVQALVAEGLLASQRGRRTYVTYQRPSEQDGKPLFSSIGSVKSNVKKFAIEVKSVRLVEELPSGWYTGRPDGSYVAITKVDKEADSPYAHSEIFIAKHVFDAFPKGAEARHKLARLVREHADPAVASGSERLRVAAADFTDSSLLGCPMSSPVARVKRIFCDTQDRIVYYALLTYRGDRFEVEHNLHDYVEDAPEPAKTPKKRK